MLLLKLGLKIYVLRVTCVAAAVHLAVVARVVGEGDDVEHVEQLAHPRPLGPGRPQHRHHRPPARPRHAARRRHCGHSRNITITPRALVLGSLTVKS